MADIVKHSGVLKGQNGKFTVSEEVGPSISLCGPSKNGVLKQLNGGEGGL